MIECTPKGICSWSFHLEGDGHRGATQCHWLSERGSLEADGERFVVLKHGLLSGQWTLEGAGGVHAEASKSSAFTRTFEVRGPRGALRVRAESAFGRTFHLVRDDAVVAIIRPRHAMTRRATIEIRGPGVEWPLTCFSFWLAVLTWRRSGQQT